MLLACTACKAHGASGLTPRKASSSEDLPSDCPPIATISGMGKLSPMATDVDCRRLDEVECGHSRWSEVVWSRLQALLELHLYAS